MVSAIANRNPQRPAHSFTSALDTAYTLAHFLCSIWQRSKSTVESGRLTVCPSRFLLKYAARDLVVLLARGTGGVAEIRIAIDGYEEKSPLYGFLQYRRRKVVLRYVPNGISRLLQGMFHQRLAVESLSRFLNCLLDFSASGLEVSPLMCLVSSTHYGSIPVRRGQILPARHYLFPLRFVRIDRKCALFCLLIARRLGFDNLVLQFPTSPQTG